MDKDSLKGLHPETIATEAGRDPENNFGIVNPPVYHASTILYPSLDAMEAILGKEFEGVRYGRFGTPTTFALEEAVAALEGGYRCVSVSSGLGAITTALLAVLKAGDHLLMVDSVYGPTRKFCDQMLTGFGVAVTYYDPAIGGDIAGLIQDNTRALFLESPGSLTFEMQDVPALCAAAHDRGVLVLMDNTWGTPIGFPALKRGVDISIQAATKYIVGHSDSMLGTLTATEAAYPAIKRTAMTLGQCAGPDDCYLALRGLRTLPVRLRQHHQTALTLCDWLEHQPEVQRVLYPARPADPGYALWQRDFTAACGLFAIELAPPVPRPALAAMLDPMRLFKMGASWGGYESLILPVNPKPIRTAVPWSGEGPLLRLHAGLEHVEDLIADLEAAFDRLRAAL